MAMAFYALFYATNNLLLWEAVLHRYQKQMDTSLTSTPAPKL